MRLTETAPAEIETAPLVSHEVAEIVRNQPDLVLLGDILGLIYDGLVSRAERSQ